MENGFVREGRWTPCDFYVIIRKCDRNGLRQMSIRLKGQLLLNIRRKLYYINSLFYSCK